MEQFTDPSLSSTFNHHDHDDDDDGKLTVFHRQVIIVGAGLGGLGAAIAVLLAGHDVTVLEAAAHIGEVGAGIQVLPNSARVLFSWGLHDALEPFATKPSRCNFWGWKGNHLAAQDYDGYTRASGAPFWDFYRMNLHKCLLDRAVALGATIVTDARATGFAVVSEPSERDGSDNNNNNKADDDDDDDGRDQQCTVYTADGRSFTGDLVVGADGIHSRLRECLVGREDPPIPTGDLAYRLLLNTERMRADPDLAPFVDAPQVNYWLGPDKHAVNYVLRGQPRPTAADAAEPNLLFNMVLLVPDDLPAGADTLAGTRDEMRSHFADWDPRIPKLLSLCDAVLKWRLLIRPGLDRWSHPSGTLTMLGDAVHATLPYLASGAGMALEDAGVLGLCLRRVRARSDTTRALAVYEACRRARTEAVVRRGTYNQAMYHLPDGPAQRERDEKLRLFSEADAAWLSSENPTLPAVQETGDDPFPWRYHGVGRWLLTYDMWKDVDEKWSALDRSRPATGEAARL